MIDLSLLFNNSAAAKSGEAASNLFAGKHAAGKGIQAVAHNSSDSEAADSFAQHMNRLKPPADEIHELLAQAKHGNAQFPAAETVAESMVGNGYAANEQVLNAEQLLAEKLQGEFPQGILSQQGSTEEALADANQPLTSEELSLLFQQMNLNDPVHGHQAGTASSGNTMSGVATHNPQSAVDLAQRAQMLAQAPNGQSHTPPSAQASNSGSSPVQGNAQLSPAQPEGAQINATGANARPPEGLQQLQQHAAEQSVRQASGEQRQMNPMGMNPQQTAQLQAAQALEGMPRDQLTTEQLRAAQGGTLATQVAADSEWVRREITVKQESPQTKINSDKLPEFQFRAQVQAQAQQIIASGNQQVPLAGADSALNGSTIQGSGQTADNQFNGLTQQLNSQPAQSSQQPGTTAGAQAMQYAQLGAQVGSQAWNQQLGQQLIQMAIHNQQQISLRLNPAELGQVLVNLQMDEHGAQLQLVSQNAQARAALEQALPQLRESLAEQGIELGQSSVSDQEKQFANQHEQDSAPHASSGQAETAQGEAEGQSGVTGTSQTGHDGHIDLYA